MLSGSHVLSRPERNSTLAPQRRCIDVSSELLPEMPDTLKKGEK